MFVEMEIDAGAAAAAVAAAIVASSSGAGEAAPSVASASTTGDPSSLGTVTVAIGGGAAACARFVVGTVTTVAAPPAAGHSSPSVRFASLAPFLEGLRSGSSNSSGAWMSGAISGIGPSVSHASRGAAAIARFGTCAAPAGLLSRDRVATAARADGGGTAAVGSRSIETAIVFSCRGAAEDNGALTLAVAA